MLTSPSGVPITPQFVSIGIPDAVVGIGVDLGDVQPGCTLTVNWIDCERKSASQLFKEGIDDYQLQPHPKPRRRLKFTAQ